MTKAATMFMAAVLGSATIFANGVDKPATVRIGGRNVATKIDHARLDQVMYQRNGGKIAVPGSRAGRVVFVNTQKAAAVELLEEVAEEFRKNVKITIDVEHGSFEFPAPELRGEASLFVVDDVAMPPLLVAPESRWAMVNVAGLRKGAGEKDAFFKARVKKELVRGFALLAGAQDSGYPDALVGCIVQPEQLDKFFDTRLPMDVVARFTPYLQKYGITPVVETTYRKACQDGWAPPPVDDVQRAIWDMVQAEKERGPAVQRPIRRQGQPPRPPRRAK